MERPGPWLMMPALKRTIEVRDFSERSPTNASGRRRRASAPPPHECGGSHRSTNPRNSEGRQATGPRRKGVVAAAHATSNQRRGRFLLVLTAGIWRVEAQAGLPVLLGGESSKEPAPRTASGRGQTAGCRRYKRKGLRRTNAAVVFFLSLLLGAGELGRRLKPTLPNGALVGCGFFFALFVYFVEEVFEFYFLLGGH